jgi:protocatechuate 3,4-dioxygenase alpha subunit
MAKLRQTPSQTVGPYFAYGLAPEQYGYQQNLTSIAGSQLANSETEGEHIRVEGRVFDGAGNPISDALIEIWQADAMGRYAHPADPRGSNSTFKGFGRCGTGTDPQNRFWFVTVKPGQLDAEQAPHLNVIVSMRGMLLHAFTRIYFSDEPTNAVDKVLSSVPAERRGTLIATRAGGNVYRFDIHMQGEQETVFFDA